MSRRFNVPIIIMRYPVRQFTRLLTRPCTTTLVFLSLLFSQVLVCGHSHAGLSGRMLAKHLALFHANDARPIPVDAWHLHAEWRPAGLPADLGVASDAVTKDDSRSIAPTDASDDAFPQKHFVARRLDVSTGPHGPARHRCALHLQLSTFLI